MFDKVPLNCVVLQRQKLSFAQPGLPHRPRSDFKEPSTLDWDSDDERNFEAEQGELKSIATDAVFVEALVLSTWAAGNVYLPPTNDYDIWRRNVFLCAFPVAWVSYVVQQACTCLALEAMKRGAQNRDT